MQKIVYILILLSGCADKLDKINQTVNQHEYIPGKYDCRNFAEEKYKALIKNGYKSKEIKFVITSYQDKPHVVLNVNNWILDNNYKNYYPATLKLQDGISYEIWNYYRKSSI